MIFREESNHSLAELKLKRMFSAFIQAKVEGRFAKSIVCMSDCSLLSLHVLERTNLKISDATIRGLFGIECRRKEPSLYTLEVFANYLGYDSSAQLRSEFNRVKFEELNQFEFKQ